MKYALNKLTTINAKACELRFRCCLVWFPHTDLHTLDLKELDLRIVPYGGLHVAQIYDSPDVGVQFAGVPESSRNLADGGAGQGGEACFEQEAQLRRLQATG